jgi:hypothetical protein
MRRVTDVDTNIDIGQGLHVGSVAKEKGLVLDREVEIEGDEEELAPKFLNFIFLLYYLNFFLFFIIFLLFFYYFFFLFYYYYFFFILLFFFHRFFFIFFLLSFSSEAQFVPKIGWRLRAARYLTSTSCSLGTIIK